eukprot:XP_011664865.1 PREDICTED: ral GTPase-activating protein subunit beta [Strongylocentrotus purpuratus]
MYMCILDSAMSESVEAKTSNSETPSRKESTSSVNDSEENTENAPPGSSLSGSLFALIDAAFQETSNPPITTDTAWAIFVRCCHLVFQQLMSTWSKDCGVAMAALELLSGVARIPMKVQDPLECKRNVKWICDHIAKQCNQPSVYHSRDLHSIIVAAFNCLTVWVVEHSYLLKDRETLQIVLEVVELGISGTKSQPKASIPAVLKQAKELKPTSTRVKNAAQGVLSCILNQLGSFPAPCGPSTVVSLLDETSLLKYVDLPNPEVKPTFKYFVMDNSILLAMLEEPLKFTKELLPTVTVIIRGPTGRHVWTFQLRHSSRKDKETAEARLIYPERPQPNDSMGTHHEITSKYFPDSINKIPITKETLQIVLEVVELGISGTKSQPKASIPAVLKQAKELKPTSTRVKNAAQGVLSCILNQLGSFPAPCGPSTVVSLLDETSLLKYVDLPNPEVKPTFKYFVMDNSILLAMLEEPLKFTKELLPTVTVIIRGPTGRHVWTFQLRHSSRKDKETAEARLIYPERPQPNDSMGTHHEITSKYFPDSINKIPITKADQSIPSLDEIETEESHEDHVTLGKLLQDQMEYEKLVSDTAHEETERVSYPNPQTESRPPKPCTEFSPARLLLSHLGYLNIESLQGPENSSLPPALVAIDDTQAGFTPDLLHLDEIPSRTFDTAFIFYVKTGQKKAEDILFNVKSKDNVQYQFLEFLQALGWPVVIGQHAGWTGHMTTSWKIPDFDANTKTQSNGNVKEELSHGGSLYSGKKQVLYFADFSSEIAFVVPTDDEPKVASNDDATQLSPVPEEPNPAQPPSSSTQQGVQPRPADLEASGSSSNSSLAGSLAGSLERPSRKFSTKGVNATPPELKVLVVWLENFEDHQTFPLADLLHKTSTGSENLTTSNNSLSKTPEPSIMIIYIHLLKSGLFRIHIQSSCTLAIPLVDGMVVSRRTLGTLVRQTVVNTCNRKRLESEKYSPPHVRRRQRIQEMVQKYQRKQSVSEFYTSLFTS